MEVDVGEGSEAGSVEEMVEEGMVVVVVEEVLGEVEALEVVEVEGSEEDTNHYFCLFDSHM
jgi:hypothetical protein